ncbi:mitochondrial import receptor subunit TOM34 isoform 2-T2 [Polymixia lowei]
MPHKRRSQSWVELKQAGNERFKTGQYGEAAELYSRAIKELEKSGKKSPEDLSILYSNRAASYLKDGNCGECVKDCNAMTKVLSDMDGPSWREKLPALPTVSLAVREKMVQQARQTAGPQVPTQHNGNTHTPAPSEQDIRRGQVLKEEGNALVKKGQHQKAIERYSQSLKHNPTEVTTYTNRALCYLSVKQYRAAVRDCDAALLIDTSNIKALYRRSQAHRELKDITSCVEDLNSLLEVEPKNSAALKLLQEVQKKK